MMQVTFLDHSGFLVETDVVTLLFDWWKGELPAMKPGVPLYVFASHRHEDHFNPQIFALDTWKEEVLDDGDRDVYFLLGKGVSLDLLRRRLWGISPETAGKIRVCQGGQVLSLPQAEIETLTSTDEGVAFLVTLPDGRTVFHAGDLNWWHWEGEDKAWNHNMAANYRNEVDRLKGQHFHAAFVPIDPRLSEAYYWGIRYFLEQTDAEHVFPMHFWGKYELCTKLAGQPEMAGLLSHYHPIGYQGQEWNLC